MQFLSLGKQCATQQGHKAAVGGPVQLLEVVFSVLNEKPFHESILLFQTQDWCFTYESTAVELNLNHSSLRQQAGS